MADRFCDRTEAGRRLAALLGSYAGRPDVLVLALPRGGVPVAFEVARALHAPLDVLVVRKLGVPGQEELALGAIASGGVLVLNEQLIRRLRLTSGTIDAIAAVEQCELERREQAYRGDLPPADVAGRTVIVVDDGLATGTSMHAAVVTLRERRPARIVVAVPLAALDGCATFRPLVDEIVWVLAPDPLYAVGMWYDDFAPTTDKQVRRLLRQAAQLCVEKGGTPMSTETSSLTTFLKDNAVDFEIVHHRRDYTAQETAADTRTPGRAFAKTVIVWVDGSYAMVVLPAHHQIDFRKLRHELDAMIVRLASEEECRDLCPECETGALPPFGNLYEVPVYVSNVLSEAEKITFNAGSHADAIRMDYHDWRKLVRPRVLDLSKPA
ncbi:MAG TPA: YbaK/EbsC family protein [Roseiflexaceae bacterium]